MFQGSLVALITPFKNGTVDEQALEPLVEWHIEQGTNGIVPCGTTGESWMLTHEEQKRIIEICVSIAAQRVPIIPGTSAISTEETISLTKQALNCGANGALIVTPPYVKPTQAGLYQHFKTINEEVNLPIIIYNNPSRAGVKIDIETLAQLAMLPNIIGVKDATGDLSAPIRIRLATNQNFCVLSGDDPTAIAFLAQGGHGCISITANVAPKQCAELYSNMGTNELRDQVQLLHHALLVESNPVPVKYAASLLDLCSEEVRKPLVALSDTSKAIVHKAMHAAGILNNIIPIRAT